MRSLIILVLTACAPDVVECTPLVVEPIDCATQPALCGLAVTSTVRDADPARAIDLVFVPEGYTAAELGAFHADVASLIGELDADRRGIVGRAPGLFNFHVVDLASATDDVADADRRDTALAACLASDPTGVHDQPALVVDLDRAELVATANAPFADVVVVVVHGAAGRANANARRLAIVVLGNDDGGRTLTHELGHALFDLGDEYGSGDACYDGEPSLAYATGRDDFFATPNLSHDPSGAKWAQLVPGARPGGRGYGRCVYHPTNDCRMRDKTSDDFCPVCAAEIDRALALRAAGDNDGAPACLLGTDQDPHAVRGPLRLVGRIRDRDLPLETTLRIDGDEVVESRSAHRDGETMPTITLSPGIHSLELECRDAGDQVAYAAMLVDAVE